MASLAAQGQKSTDQLASGKDWDISAEHGPSERIRFDTEEGTWLSLDVHPSGKEVVFSLLGDLYTVPMTGGTTRRLTSGPAYDVQPRYSPDGRMIAFASDRGGGENIWLMRADGRQPRQVSDDKESIVNSPAWSPHGGYLIASKRLTDRSTIDTVELWMWHREGGAGIQVTVKDEEP